MTTIRTQLPPTSRTNTGDDQDDTPPPASRQPFIQSRGNNQLKGGARNEGGGTGPFERQGFLDKAASTAQMIRTGNNSLRYATGALVEGIDTALSLKAKPPARSRLASHHYPKYKLSSKGVDLPLRTLTTINGAKDQAVGDAIASSAKLTTDAVETVTGIASKAYERKPLPPRPTVLSEVTSEAVPPKARTPSRIRRPRPPRPTVLPELNLAAAPPKTLVPSSFRPSRIRPPRPPRPTVLPDVTSAAAPPKTRVGSSIKPSRIRPPRPPRPTVLPDVPSAAARPKTPTGSRLRPLLPPRFSSPPLSPASSSASVVPKGSAVLTGLSRVGTGASAIGSGLDIYFGVKQAVEERESAGKAQGILVATAGTAGLTASAAGIAGAAGMTGATTTAAVLGVGANALAAVAVGMSAIPAIHGRDNKNRAVKLYNDVSHEMTQMGEADRQLFQRINVQLTPTLEGLENRYDVQTRTVWLNNNAADFLNQVNSRNNTTSGQWKPDDKGQVWSNFSDKYIRIEGTPHQDNVALDLRAEKDGGRPPSAGTDAIITVPGDTNPEKAPTQLKSLAADPARYRDEGWSASMGQPQVTKDYGYQTSGWGQHWETNIPFSVNAGPLYLSHPVRENGQDTVVLIDDTPVERPDRPVPKDGFTEGARFGHDGKDGERLTAKQVAELLMADKPATIGDKFNVAAVPGKADENAYREAAYPVQAGTTYIRSPDAFRREIITQPEHRTVVSLQNVSHPTQITLQNERDIIDMPSVPRGDVRISLPALPAGAVDDRRLGITDQQMMPRFKEQSITGEGKSARYANTYMVGNGGTLTVEADDPARIERFISASS